jgi:hypothetical protein
LLDGDQTKQRVKEQFSNKQKTAGEDGELGQDDKMGTGWMNRGEQRWARASAL